MNSQIKHCVVLVTALSSLSAFASARTNIVKTLTNDWSDPNSFEDSTWLPGDGDEDFVIVPRNATVTVSDDNATSLNQFKKLKRVILASETSEIDLVFAGNAELNVPMTGYKYATGSRDMKCGPIVKKGVGTLSLNSASFAPAAADTVFDYYSEIRVETGTLKLQQGTAKKYHYLGRISVWKDATVYLPSSSVSGNEIRVQGLDGEGTVTVDANVASILRYQGSLAVNPACLSGKLSGTYAQMLFESTGQSMTGGKSDATIPNIYIAPAQNLAEGRVGLAGLNGKNQNSSLGYNVAEVTVTGKTDSRIVFEGQDETSLCGLVLNTSGYRALLDCGLKGGLIWSQIIQRQWRSTYGQGLVLCGAAPVTNKVANSIVDNTDSSDANARGHCLYLSKEGASTWSLGNYARDHFACGISVDEGVLQYETMASRGIACSLGLATNLTDGTIGATDNDPSHRVEYAIRLGAAKTDGTFADSARLEYTGTTDFLVTNRPIAVAGKGGLRNNGAARAWYRGISGISSTDMTLYLDGNGTNTNEANNVSNGTAGGKLSVVKSGSGTWVLSGEQSWSGDLTVNGGRLIVSNPQNYRWYKWCVTALVPAELNPADQTSNRARLAEFALCAADRTELTRNYSIEQRADMTIQPGKAALVYDGPLTVSAATSLNRLFDGMAYHSGNVDVGFYRTVDKVTTYYRPTQDDPSTWLTFVMRLPADAPAVVGYDYANMRGTNYGDGYTCISNYFVEASLDGCAWTRLKTFEGESAPSTKNGCDWKYSGGDVEVTTSSGTVLLHPNVNWDPIDPAPSAYPNVMENVGTVSVSGGATLELEPGSRPVVFDDLRVDAKAGAGSIVGFTLAQDGTLTVENLDSKDHEVELPIDISNATDARNVSGWTLVVNGKNVTDKGWRIRSAGGKVSVIRPGMMLLVR